MTAVGNVPDVPGIVYLCHLERAGRKTVFLPLKKALLPPDSTHFRQLFSS
jgi:hypothetical protein